LIKRHFVCPDQVNARGKCASYKIYACRNYYR